MSPALFRSVLLCLVFGGAAVAHAAEPDFHVKPPDLVGGGPGDLRRIVQPFGAWTLVCDENLKKRERVCNVTQQILDRSNQVVFSWSMAATRAGAPVMVVRVAKGDAASRFVHVALPGTARVTVELTSCDESLCLGFMPVGAELGRRLMTVDKAEITLMRDGRLATLDAPLGDLALAIKAIR